MNALLIPVFALGTVLATGLERSPFSAEPAAAAKHPEWRDCHPGHRSTPPAGSGCLRDCGSSPCQVGSTLGFTAPACVDVTFVNYCTESGPSRSIVCYDYLCVWDYSLECEGDEFGCKWQVDALSGHYVNFQDCENL